MKTKSLEIIPFTSRYGDKYSLILVGNNIYKADFGEGAGYRVGGWNPGETQKGYSFVDPSGGPFIAVGSIFPDDARGIGRKVKYITNGPDGKGIYIEFEKWSSKTK